MSYDTITISVHYLDNNMNLALTHKFKTFRDAPEVLNFTNFKAKIYFTGAITNVTN